MNMLENEKIILGKRILEISERSGFKLKAFATEIDFSYSNLQKYTTGKSQPSAPLYIALYNYGINLHWLVSGEGEMFRTAKGAEDTAASYSYQGNNVAVHNNHGTVATGVKESEAVGRGSRICAWVTEYMKTHDSDEQAWLDVEMTRHFSEYKKWKGENGF